MIELLNASVYNKDFRLWLEQLKELGCLYEVVIEDGKITKVYVKMPDDGDWKTVRFGRIIGSKVISYIRMTYLPRLVDGKFKYTINEKE